MVMATWNDLLARFPEPHVLLAVLSDLSGAVKDAACGLTGDAKLQAEGKMDKAKGAVRTAVGDVKDAVKDTKK
jgi:uncharacterized protein YjbJ (UPF0337 family)